MLEASDEIDFKPSLRACSRGRDLIFVSTVFSRLKAGPRKNARFK